MMNRENDIIKQLQQGSASALRDLMELHQNYVFTIALRIVKNREKAEEVTQDVFIKIYQNIKSYRFHSKFTTWLYTIVYRTALNAVNKKELLTSSADENPFENDALLNQQVYTRDNGFDNHNDFEINDILWQAIDHLPLMQGLCISLFYLNQFNIEEISSVLKIPQNTVKTHLHRGRKKLKTILLKEYRMEEII